MQKTTVNINEQIIKILLSAKILNQNRLKKVKNRMANNYKVGIVSNAELLYTYKHLLKKKKISAKPEIEHLLKKRAIRTLSGVAPVAVLTKHYKCPGNCAFCPNEKDMPKSYLSNEPAVMRAILTKFNPYDQVKYRLRALEEHGHQTDKIELIIMGGTFSFLPKQYQTWFIRRCFDACNKKTSQSLAQAQKTNERAKHRIIGLTLETRPDYINQKELIRFRQLGCTKIEIGVQAIDNKILELNQRGDTVEQIVKATKLMKQAGFKVAYHMMPNLPGSTPTKDFKMFEKLFSDENFQPDMLKIYPTVVTAGTKIYTWWKKGKFKPYSNKQLITLLIKIKKIIPNYVRIIRLIRDIPEQSILAGNKVSNLRQTLKTQLDEQGVECQCIRCREARENITGISKAKLFIVKYPASEGTEYFLHYSSPNKKILYAFLRLRLDQKFKHFIPELQDCALIREVHTYGKLISLGSKEKAVQHMGFGKKLLLEAEKIAKKNNFDKIA
ncbi:hypothetical protein A2223_01230, partial [Candidatus Falkowbacteria bacterium RIFOXYA2_FULL_35_8]